MTDENPTSQDPAASQPRWQPIGSIDRRVAGVLVEKAKTTPDAYPMSLNAIRNACNQKNNRWPAMALETEHVEESLERLRLQGAVGFIEGHGRVPKYRHYLYDWLAVDKVELAVMAELLLRGAQTEGELRGRAARMEPIADLAALRVILESLKTKGLVVGLTPEGRGHVVVHALYEPAERDRIQAEYGGEAATAEASAPPPTPGVAVPTAAPVPVSAATPTTEKEIVETIRHDIEELRCHVAGLRSDLDELLSEHRRLDDDVRGLKDALGA